MEEQYANQLNPEIMAGFDKSPFMTEGCTITSLDGSTARIISTPRSSGLIVAREGVPMGEDFLTDGRE